MPTRAQYEQVIRSILDPYLVDVSSVWRGFYRLLLWFEHGVPHIIESNKLKQGIWRARAEAVCDALAQEFGCSSAAVVQQVDQLVRSPIFPTPPQRHNPLGIGFVTALFVALERFSSRRYQFYPEEAIGRQVFQGIRAAPRSRLDIVVVENGKEICVLSAKWSLRHDRLKEVKDEVDYFKTLQSRLGFYVVTNEFCPSRLTKLLDDYRIDGVFHVHRPFVVDVAGLDDCLENLRDLSELLLMFIT